MFTEIMQKYQKGLRSLPAPQLMAGTSAFKDAGARPDAADKAEAAGRTGIGALDEQWIRETIALGETFLNYEYPSLSATDFMDFARTGNRSRFEAKYFARRHALNALVLAEWVEWKGRFLDDILNGIFCICEESAWQLPPHNTYIRDTPQLLLPDCSRPVLDLFACETGAVLAAVSYLLKEKLDAVSPFVCERITAELDRRIFTPYLNCHFWWMGNGKEPMNNWTIWCTQNVLLSAFLTGIAPETGKQILSKACVSADYFLAEYGEDGCCDEGAQYYRHAGLCLFQTLEILNAVTDNAFASLYLEPKIKNIASYILNVHVSDEYYVNFADCSPVAGRAGVREFLFALRTDHAEMARFAAADFMAGGYDSLLLPTENNLYYRLQNGLHAAQIKAYAAKETAPVFHPDIYYPSVGLFIARDDTFCLAVKAGDNADSHNHNDTGSFTVYKNGLPLFIDAGVESYTKKTFSPRRYEIWTMQSAYHNLPTVNGILQADGESYKAENVLWRMDPSVCEIEMDIASAYPPESGLACYKRKAALYKNKEIVIRDTFAFRNGSDCSIPSAARDAASSDAAAPGSHPVILSLMTYEKPILLSREDGLRFRIGELGSLLVTSGIYLKTETIPITDERLQVTWKHEIYRTLIAATDTSPEFHIQ